MTDERSDGVTRRSVLKTGAATAGAVTIGAAGAAAHHDEDHEGGKRGGRAQVDGDARRNVPFELNSMPSMVSLGASCMSEESASQTYLGYEIQYCDSQEDQTDARLYLIPDEAPLVQDETYEIRSIQTCKEPGDGPDDDEYESDEIQKVAFSPANHECPE